MWKKGTVRIAELQNQDKNETCTQKEQEKQGQHRKMYTIVCINKLDRIVAEN